MALNIQEKRNRDGSIKSRGIEWTDATWNPIAGCPHQCRWEMPDGTVAVCYAESIAEGIASSVYPQGFDAHYWKPHMLEDPLKKKDPMRIFVGSMSDVFAYTVPAEQIEAILDIVRQTPQHTYQMLTKNPLRAKDFDLPENVWLGASMPPDFMWGRALSQNQKERMLRRTLSSLRDAKASIKWMSCEPLSWNVAPIIREFPDVLDWVVIGAASNGSKYYAPADNDFLALSVLLWEFNIPVFYKGNMKVMGKRVHRWREEFPDDVYPDAEEISILMNSGSPPNKIEITQNERRKWRFDIVATRWGSSSPHLYNTRDEALELVRNELQTMLSDKRDGAEARQMLNKLETVLAEPKQLLLL